MDINKITAKILQDIRVSIDKANEYKAIEMRIELLKYELNRHEDNYDANAHCNIESDLNETIRTS